MTVTWLLLGLWSHLKHPHTQNGLWHWCLQEESVNLAGHQQPKILLFWFGQISLLMLDTLLPEWLYLGFCWGFGATWSIYILRRTCHWFFMKNQSIRVSTAWDIVVLVQLNFLPNGGYSFAWMTATWLLLGLWSCFKHLHTWKDLNHWYLQEEAVNLGVNSLRYCCFGLAGFPCWCWILFYLNDCILASAGTLEALEASTYLAGPAALVFGSRISQFGCQQPEILLFWFSHAFTILAIHSQF